MNDQQISAQAATEPQEWPQAWEWEEFLFGGKLHRCGYATGRVMVLVVALGSPLTEHPLAH
jgi:hypothetical protein